MTTVTPTTPATPTGRPPRWTRANIIDAIRRYADEHGRPPTSADWKNGTADRPAGRTVARYFKTFPDAVAAAGLDPTPARRIDPRDFLERLDARIDRLEATLRDARLEDRAAVRRELVALGDELRAVVRADREPMEGNSP